MSESVKSFIARTKSNDRKCNSDDASKLQRMSKLMETNATDTQRRKDNLLRWQLSDYGFCR